VSLVWGTLLFKGRVKALRIDFKLFKNDGSPLRAVANVTFAGSVEDNLRVARENAQSPDLTHHMQVKQKDTIHLLSNTVYGNSSQYIRVAQANELNHFRKLKTGQTLRFPPFKTEGKK
jgi:nucleoid-associated protein YgaU